MKGGTGCKGRNRNVKKVDDGGRIKVGPPAIEFHTIQALRDGAMTLEDIEGYLEKQMVIKQDRNEVLLTLRDMDRRRVIRSMVVERKGRSVVVFELTG